MDFGPRSWAINITPLHTPLSPPPNLAWARTLAQRQLSLPVRSLGSSWRGAGSPHNAEPHSRHPSRLRSGVLSHGGGAVGRRDAHTVGGKADAGPSNVTPYHLGLSTCSVRSRKRGSGWQEAGAESSPAGLPHPRKGLGAGSRLPFRRIRAQMLAGAGGDFQKDSSQLVKNPTPLHPLSPASKSGQHGSAKVTREWGWGNAQTLAPPRAREHPMGVRSIPEWRVPKEKGNKGRAAIPEGPHSPW